MKRLSIEEERELLTECIYNGRGDKLIQYYWNMVYLAARKTFLLRGIPFSAEDIEDARNDAFIRLLDNGCRRLKLYNPDKGLRLHNWIKLITAQATKMYIKKKMKNNESGYKDFIFVEKIKEELGVVNEEERLDFRETLRQIMEAVENLPTQEKLVFKLFFFENLSLSEIASFLHKKKNYVYQLKYRAVRRLKKIIMN